MDYKKRYLDLKAELAVCKADLNIEYAKQFPDIARIEQLQHQILVYKNNLNNITRVMKQLTEQSDDIEMKVFLYHYCYGWSLDRVSKKTFFSLPYIKKISSKIKGKL